MDILDLIGELQKFSKKILQLGGSADVNVIRDWENKSDINLPVDYKTLIAQYNGLALMGTQVYGVKENGKYSLEDCYLFEHFEVENPMPLYLVPFSPDGRGNHYCFDSRTQNDVSCSICFWQHDYSYSEDDQPEIVNISFTDWIKEVVIDWTLEDFDYEGNPR